MHLGLKLGIPGRVLPLGFGGDLDVFKLSKKDFPNITGLVNGTTTLFTPSGGAVAIWGIGKVTAAMVGFDTTAKIEVGVPTIISNFFRTNTTVTTGGYPINGWWSGTSAAVVPGYAPGSNMSVGLVIDPTTPIILTKTGAAFTAGGFTACFWWFPLDDGATLITAP